MGKGDCSAFLGFFVLLYLVEWRLGTGAKLEDLRVGSMGKIL